MTKTPVERWMLPDGIEEILPPEAGKIDGLRRSLLDLFKRWGYQLVIPPMVEFTDSLLVGLGKDMDLLTFKVTDQLSGRSMGIRADMTPQIARIDAHSLNRQGVARLCYSGHVLKTSVDNPLETRSPIQVGAELFAAPALDAEIEVISMLLAAFEHAAIAELCLDLGHVGIYRALAECAGFTETEEEEFFTLLQAKALTEIAQWVAAHVSDPCLAAWFLALPRLSGALPVLDAARKLLDGAPDEVFAAFDELESVAAVISSRFPEVALYFDLGELTGYHYATGVVFAAFVPGQGGAIARGSRYDHIGEVFGRARSAIGFTADLVLMSRLSTRAAVQPSAIFVSPSDHPKQWQAVCELRNAGEVVVCGMSGQTAPLAHQNCDRQLLEENGEFRIKPL